MRFYKHGKVVKAVLLGSNILNTVCRGEFLKKNTPKGSCHKVIRINLAIIFPFHQATNCDSPRLLDCWPVGLSKPPSVD